MRTYLKKLLSRPWFAPASLVIIIGSFFIEFLFSRSKFLVYQHYSELLFQWYPYLEYWTAMLKAGQAPLWSHNLAMGFPLGSFPHAGTFYPFSLVFLAMDFAKGFTLLIFIEAECQILLLYGLLREWGCSRYASWLGALAFGLAGFSLHGTGYLADHNMSIWMPGMFWLGLRLARRKKIGDFLALMFFCSLGYLTGEVELLIFSCMILLVFLLAAERAGLIRTGLVAGALAASLPMCAAPFLLTSDYLAHSFRAAGGFNPIDAVNLWPKIAGWLILLVPAIQSSKLVFPGYLGFLLPLGLFCWPERVQGRRLLHLTLGMIAFSIFYWINPWPLSYLFNNLPILRFESMDQRIRMLGPCFLLVLLCAGESFDRFHHGVKPNQAKGLIAFIGIFLAVQGAWLVFAFTQLQKSGALAASRLVLIAALFFLGFNVWTKVRKREMIIISPSALIVILLLDLFTLSWLCLPRNDPSLLETNPRIFNQEHVLVPERANLVSLFDNDPAMWLQVRLDRGPGWIFSYIRNGLKRQDAIRKRLDIPGTSNFMFQAIQSNTQPLFDYLAVKEVAAHLAPVLLAERVPLLLPVLKSNYQVKGVYKGPRPEQGAAGVVMAPGSEWALTMDLVPGDGLEMEVRPESAASLVKVQLEQGTDSALLSWTDAQPPAQEPGRKKLLLPVTKPGEALLQIRIADGGGRDVTLIEPEIANGLRPYYEESRMPGTIIYRNREALDLYGLYTAVDAVPDARALDYLFDPQRFDPKRRLMLAPGDVDPRIPAQAARPRQAGDVKVKEYLNNRVELESDSAKPCYLSIAETYYPGWRAWVDGVEEKIVHADYAFQAVALETAGPHRIVLRFIPAEFRVGLWVSLGSTAMFLLLVLWRVLGIDSRQSTEAVRL